MERSVTMIVAMAIAVLCGAQTSVQVAFNLANCEAHSRQLKALALLDPAMPKVLLLGQADSAITPWIMDRFGLKEVSGLSFGYLPADRLARYFSPMGSSTVHVMNGRDTVACFSLEDLPARIGSINALVRSPVQHIRTSRRKVENTDRTSLSSDVHIAASRRSLWMLDRFLGALHRVDLTDTAKAAMHQVATIKALLEAAPRPGPAYSTLWIQPDVIGSVDTTLDAPTLLVECIDTTGANAEFHRILLTLRDGQAARIEETDIDPRPDGVFPSMGPTGFAMQGDRMIAQVNKNMDDGNGFPLFAHYGRRRGRVVLADVAPYDHHRGALRSLPAYNFTNGSVCDRYFAYAIAPVVVDLRSWEELDLSAALGVQLDSALRFVPGHYYTLDMECDEQGLTLLCVIKGSFQLATFEQRTHGLQLASLDMIDMGDFNVGTGTLIDRRSFVFTSRKKDEVLTGRYTP